MFVVFYSVRIKIRWLQDQATTKRCVDTSGSYEGGSDIIYKFDTAELGLPLPRAQGLWLQTIRFKIKLIYT